MPKDIIDYQNTIIYKIVCNDLSISDAYVGHTTNFTKRKQQHKNNCNNINKKAYNFKVYQMIRDNGGWDNWVMIEIEKYPCNDRNEAAARERYWYEHFNAGLNMVCPNRCKKESDKVYYKNNKHKIIEQHKLYYQDNKEKIKQRIKTYNENHKKEIYEMNKKYKEEHKEKYREYMKTYRENNKGKYKLNTNPYECECGATFQYCYKSKHLKSAKHKQYIESK